MKKNKYISGSMVQEARAGIQDSLDFDGDEALHYPK